jgi:hypothetical protein
MTDDLLDSYSKCDDYISALMLLSRQRVPFEKWPKEIQAICGLNLELLGINDHR